MVRTCQSKRKNKIEELKFHKLPTSDIKVKEWIDASDNPKVKDIHLKCYRICSIHFEDKYIVTHPHEVLYGLAPPRTYRGLTEDAIPTLHLPKRSKAVQMEVDIPVKAIDALPESCDPLRDLPNDAAVNLPDLPNDAALNFICSKCFTEYEINKSETLKSTQLNGTPVNLPESSVQADKENLRKCVDKYEKIIGTMKVKMMRMKRKIKALQKSTANIPKLQKKLNNSIQKSAVVESL